jgi:hypothetical protein
MGRENSTKSYPHQVLVVRHSPPHCTISLPPNTLTLPILNLAPTRFFRVPSPCPPTHQTRYANVDSINGEVSCKPRQLMTAKVKRRKRICVYADRRCLCGHRTARFNKPCPQQLVSPGIKWSTRTRAGTASIDQFSGFLKSIKVRLGVQNLM